MYSLKKHKTNKNARILTFNKKAIDKFSTVHPDAVSLLLFKIKEYFERDQGIEILWNYEQFQLLSKRIDISSKNNDIIQHRIKTWFRDGVRILDCDLEQILKTSDVFYKLVDKIND